MEPKISERQSKADDYMKDYLERILQTVLSISDDTTKRLGRQISRLQEDVRKLRLALTQD